MSGTIFHVAILLIVSLPFMWRPYQQLLLTSHTYNYCIKIYNGTVYLFVMYATLATVFEVVDYELSSQAFDTMLMLD